MMRLLKIRVDQQLRIGFQALLVLPQVMSGSLQNLLIIAGSLHIRLDLIGRPGKISKSDESIFHCKEGSEEQWLSSVSRHHGSPDPVIKKYGFNLWIFKILGRDCTHQFWIFVLSLNYELVSAICPH